ncbi:hemicentin-1-like isoform X2 [Belonocnema kinseyi]|uniref:hemicentin-1-like isoform X2 n=1 Tax=Belonocnema kinseyi TaxID=2817044 RepID=UPI00143CCB39|nr:hemicentin-1-like isoform X2 [Belonocnema kinseyi]
MVLSWRIYLTIGISTHIMTLNQCHKSPATTVKTYENDTVVLPSCSPDGQLYENSETSLRVMWWRDGLLLVDSDDTNVVPPERIRLWSNGSLEVYRVQQKDTGEYKCNASRPAPWGSVIQIHAIEVMYPPSVHPLPESGELEINLGEIVDIACVAKGVPAPIMLWKSKGEVIPLLDNRDRLRFKADNISQTGRYTCVADNGVGDPAFATIDLKIRYKPIIEARKTWIHASPGIRVQLDCRVSAWPEAKVEWNFKDNKVPNSPRIVKQNNENIYSLIIRQVVSKDYGHYHCNATNSQGSAEAVIELSAVANLAVFKKESHPISKTAYNFIWEVDSYSSIIEYQFWFRRYKGEEWVKLFIPSGNDAIGPLHSRSFNLTGLQEGTYYEALVLSRNRDGWSKPSKLAIFTTEESRANKADEYTRNDAQDEKLIPVVQLASMSQQSSFDATQSGTNSNHEKSLLTLLGFSILFNQWIIT